ncbi:MAG: transcriptional repressor [Clostridia bacterium]|nr:transcriptional repressor [Clostridia bacterium]
MTTPGYKTRQKAVIEELLVKNANRHLTADDITDMLKENGNDVGRTTVYRTLERLVSDNKVRRFSMPQGESACYQYISMGETCHEHFHLKCNKCGALFHIECEQMSLLSGHIAEHHGFAVDNLKTVLYGVCRKCAGEEK